MPGVELVALGSCESRCSWFLGELALKVAVGVLETAVKACQRLHMCKWAMVVSPSWSHFAKKRMEAHWTRGKEILPLECFSFAAEKAIAMLKQSCSSEELA
ncbi:hypothetical protein TIFTF001_031665 [Ficus carica]|uniref:Uncharacterized protein n=1 Tax=Ficus carica TaxID=3494 RepID=A0AA88J5S1_FICCA|nr:hypothetical protein TIFTF001_031665 [Ficus carica]